MTPVNNIAILGVTGNVGSQILSSFLDYNRSNPSNPFKIIALTRDSSFDRTVKQLKPYFDHSFIHLQVKSIDSYGNRTALAKVLRESSTEVLISTIASLSTNDQISIVDACVESGTVKRFLPSEFGVDTSSRPLVEKNLPLAVLKLEVVEHLKEIAVKTEGRFTWTAIICGAFFDWALKLPGVLCFDLSNNQVTVFDGGDVKYEATNLGQIGRAMVACLADTGAYEASAGHYVYINSCTVTQNQIINSIEKLTGRAMERTEVSSTDVFNKGKALMAENGGLDFFRNFTPTPEVPYAAGSVEAIWACIFGGEKFDGLNQYSMRQPGLWNERLGLPVDDMEETVKNIVQELGLMKVA